VFRPAGKGPFPLVVISHGSPRSANERRSWGRIRFPAQSEAFVAMGYAVIVPTRRGYGKSEGEWAEGYGTCSNPDYYAAGMEGARDIRAAVDAVRHEPWADAQRVVLAGQSAGGFGSVAAASQHFAGLVGVVNFRRRPRLAGPDDGLRRGSAGRGDGALRRRGSRVPSSGSTAPTTASSARARAPHARGLTCVGRHAEFVEAPAIGLDGHGYFCAATDDWAPRVEAFLRASAAAREPRERRTRRKFSFEFFPPKTPRARQAAAT
jgi:pimeloyl-ACP methyl ester carboxylesterase